MAVRGVDVGARGDEEVHDGVVGTADGIVQGGDALLVGLAWVVHLGTPGGRRIQPRLSLPWLS